jgi:hypothetical protein
MSLDVYLTTKTEWVANEDDIFIRENGQVKKITPEEWQERFPGIEPVVARNDSDREVYWRNITHNLGEMASTAGIYKELWRPEEIGITTAEQLIIPLSIGLDLLIRDPEHFKQLNPPNGWGDYEGFVGFVSDYLRACKENPEAEVHVSR